MVFVVIKIQHRPATRLKRDPGKSFPCDFCKFFKIIFFIKQLWVTASEQNISIWLIHQSLCTIFFLSVLSSYGNILSLKASLSIVKKSFLLFFTIILLSRFSALIWTLIKTWEYKIWSKSIWDHFFKAYQSFKKIPIVNWKRYSFQNWFFMKRSLLPCRFFGSPVTHKINVVIKFF